MLFYMQPPLPAGALQRISHLVYNVASARFVGAQAARLEVLGRIARSGSFNTSAEAGMLKPIKLHTQGTARISTTQQMKLHMQAEGSGNKLM